MENIIVSLNKTSRNGVRDSKDSFKMYADYMISTAAVVVILIRSIPSWR
jgi:hypothetical protein